MKAFLVFLLAPLVTAGAALPPEQVEFFESRIRPVLAQDCYECHNSQGKAKGKLILDHRDALLKGGSSGPAIKPGHAEESLLIQVIRHEFDDLQMPKAGVKLDEAIIRDFVTWVNMGAPDPRDAAPSQEELAEDAAWPAVMERRKSWWSFQPIREPSVPPAGEWSGHPVDRFVLERMEEHGLSPSDPAEPRVLARRLFFTLIGLPPGKERVDRFVAEWEDDAETATAGLIDELLASSHFGERWARHWMDWIRYAESHGSEGDPVIDNAWHYRDYLIRALNADVPYDQLVREHVAGDLLEQPRLNRALGLNESLLGTAHWRMVFHGFAPTDALDEKVRFTDDQINVFSKAFLGLTVSCARCHDHKFDAISQADYYALFGILGSCRPARKVADLPETQALHREELAALKPRIRAALAEEWLASLPEVADRLNQAKTAGKDSVLAPWLAARGEADFAAGWKRLHGEWQQDFREREEHVRRAYGIRWNLGQPADSASWYRSGIGLNHAPAPAGEFAISLEEGKAIAAILPSGVFSHLVSDKHPGILTSPDFHLDGEYRLFLRIDGGGQSMARYVVQNYPRSGTVYPVTELKEDKAGQWRWQEYDLTYWKGDDIHIELSTARDAPLLVKDSDRSWFGIREAVLVRKGEAGPPAANREHLDPLFAGPSPADNAELAHRYEGALREAVEAWRDGVMTDAQALFLNACVAEGLLPNEPARMGGVHALIQHYRKLEAEIPVPLRVPSLAEWQASDQPLFERGDHKKPSQAVPRRFLEAVDATAYATSQSGRRELAEDLLRPDNPFTRRVIVNRVWHHLFGRGLVPTPDNLGRLGSAPTHPELLDYLAARFGEEDRWSLKSLIRFLLTSRTWRQSSEPSTLAASKDPDNEWLSHYSVRRLEAEAIRDSLLTVSGQLNPAPFGPPVAGNSNRRSVYVNVIRNRLDPFLSAFDAPIPFSATGRRDVTNVPSQALLMMNNAFVVDAARRLAARSAETPVESERIRLMWELAMGREPSPSENDSANRFLGELKQRYQSLQSEQARITSRLAELEVALSQLLQPVRDALLAEGRPENPAPAMAAPEPVAHWDFEDSFRDRISGLEGKPIGKVRLEEGALVLDGKSFVATAPLKRDLREKTLEAVVLLEGLDQRGGGVMTVQDLNGGVFDAIVIGEQQARHWLAGSNNFKRTEPLQGLSDNDAGTAPVRIALVYEADGTIRAYRNGIPYGKPYRKTELQPFQAGQSQVVFGLRHGTGASGNRVLTGRILEARLYDRALAAEEVAVAASGVPFVTREQVLAALTPDQRSTLSQLEAEMARWEQEREKLGKPAGEEQVWIDFAHSVLNLKEFIYLR